MPKLSPGMAEFSGYVKEDLKRRFKAACSEEGRSMSDVLSELMEEWLSYKRALLSSKRSQVNEEVAYEPVGNAMVINQGRHVSDYENRPWKPVQDHPFVPGPDLPEYSPRTHPPSRLSDHLAEAPGLGVENKIRLYTARNEGEITLSRDELEQIRKNIEAYKGVEVQIVILEENNSL